MKRAKPPQVIEPDWLDVDSLDLEAQGVAQHPDGMVVFIEGALPGESVQVQVLRQKARWKAAKAVHWRRESPYRVTPRCPHFGVCGGCSMQHLHSDAQIAIKQRVLEDTLWHIGRVKPEQMLRPLRGPDWGYRGRGRLTARLVDKKGGMLIGFHERKSSFVADMHGCAILAEPLSSLLMPLRALFMSMSKPDRMPQIEFAVTPNQLALVLRHLEPLTAADIERLQLFAKQHKVAWWLQAKGPDTVIPLDPADQDGLFYELPEFGIRMAFLPTNFTQVNQDINRALIHRAVEELQLQANSQVIDWFCGLGNFTLPIASRLPASRVLGIEGSVALVQQAANNAANNSLSVDFKAMNLFEITAQDLLQLPQADRWLLDPPREGAMVLLQALQQTQQLEHPFAVPERIVYVSCNPATLARDIGFAVHQLGYVLSKAAAVNMFPHTSHVESLVVLERSHSS